MARSWEQCQASGTECQLYRKDCQLGNSVPFLPSQQAPSHVLSLGFVFFDETNFLSGLGFYGLIFLKCNLL